MRLWLEKKAEQNRTVVRLLGKISTTLIIECFSGNFNGIITSHGSYTL